MGLFDVNVENENIGDDHRAGFTDATQIEGDMTVAKRVVDQEAGVVLYAVQWNTGPSGGYGVTAVPIEDTDLERDETTD